MLMLVDCSYCHRALQLPPGAKSILCAICHAVTLIADPRCVPPPASPATSSTHRQYYPPPYTVVNAPSPHNHAPPGPPPPVHGRKRAVLCGVSYKQSSSELQLQGCVNDVKCMKFMLVDKFRFPECAIIMLTEEETDIYKRPTRYNMILALHWLVQACQPGDSLVFHFSGHGSQQKNNTGDEVDGYDETICPLDFETEGAIVDDEINAIIVRPLPPGVKLHAIIDACHSGTVLDLPFLCRMDGVGKYVWEDHRPRSGAWKGTSGGEVISFSGCDDDQTSVDTLALSKTASTGAMTYAFIKAIIEHSHGTTYGNLLNAMRSTIRKKDNEVEGGLVTSLLTMLLNGGGHSGHLTQVPQLTTNEQFDVYTKPFTI